MSPKPNARSWNDVQTAVATAAIVTTLGMWNLFAAPAKAEEIEATPVVEKKPVLPAEPLTEPPVGYPVAGQSAGMPYVKIMFTQIAPQTTTTVVQQSQQEIKKKKKKKKDNNGGGGGGSVSVTQTQSS